MICGVDPDLFPYYTQAVWRTPVNETNRLLKQERPGPKVVLLSGGYCILCYHGKCIGQCLWTTCVLDWHCAMINLAYRLQIIFKLFFHHIFLFTWAPLFNKTWRRAKCNWMDLLNSAVSVLFFLLHFTKKTLIALNFRRLNNSRWLFLMYNKSGANGTANRRVFNSSELAAKIAVSKNSWNNTWKINI